MGPITHIAEVPMEIGGHRELAILQVANLQNHGISLGMPWLKGHNPKIDLEEQKITFDSERCITWCLDRSATIYAVPETGAREENLITRFSEIQTENVSLQVEKLTSEARIRTKESSQAAGHDLYAQEIKVIPAKGQGIISTGIAIGLPSSPYGRLAPRSGLAIKHSLTVNAGVIDADYTGEVKIVLVNLGTASYKVHQGDKIAQLIVKTIISDEGILVQDLEATIRGTKGFGSSDEGVTKQVGAAPDCLVSIPGKLQDDQTPKAATINMQKKAENSLNQNLRKVCQEAPRAQTMTNPVSACARLLSKQPWEVRGRSDKKRSHNQHPKGARSLLSEPTQETPQRAPKPMTKQVSAAPDCLVSHLQKIPGPIDQTESHNTPNGTSEGRIHLREITRISARISLCAWCARCIRSTGRTRRKSLFRMRRCVLISSGRVPYPSGRQPPSIRHLHSTLDFC